MSSNKQTVAVLGNGAVGVALAKGFAEVGYQVVFGTRNASGEKTLEALKAVPGASAATFADAARAADVAVLALPPGRGWSKVYEPLAPTTWPGNW